MIRSAAKTFAQVFCVTAVALAPACADTVVLAGKPPFRHVHITGFRGGRLVFRGVCRETLRKPLRELASFQIDADPMLSNAEALRQREPAAAVTAYRLALEEIPRGWLHDLAEARLVGALDRAGRFAEAVRLWTDLLAAHPDWAGALVPRHADRPGSLTNTQVRRRLAAAYATHLSPDVRRSLARLWLELTLYDGLDPDPAGAATRAAQSRHKQPPAASRPSGEPPPLFGAVRRKRSPGRSTSDLPQEAATLRLPADTFVLQAVRDALQAGQTGRADAIITRSMPHIDPAARGRWQLLHQRCRIEAGHYAQAADALLALSERTPNPTLAAEALYYVGVAHERMDRADVAADIYRELLERSDIPPRLRKLAADGLARTGD